MKVDVVGWEVQFDRIRNAAVSGEGPDITQAGTTQVPFFAALGGFDDLSGRIKDVGGEAAYPKGVWNTTKVAGQDGVWAVPWFTEARAIYYRKDVLEKAGVDRGDRVPGLGLDARDAPGDQGQGAGDRRPADQAVRLARQEGVRPRPPRDAVRLGRRRRRADRGQLEVRDQLAAGEPGRGVHGRPAAGRPLRPEQLERDGTQVENQFKGGRIAVWIGGPWTLASTKRSDDKNWVKAARENVGIAPMPTGPGGEGYTFVGGSNLMMFKSAKNKDAAWEVLKFMSSDDFQAKYAELLGMFPSRTAPQKAIADEDADYKSWYTAIQQGRTYAPIPQWGQIENAYKARFGEHPRHAAGGAAGRVQRRDVRSSSTAAPRRPTRCSPRARRLNDRRRGPPRRLALAAAGRAGRPAAAAGPARPRRAAAAARAHRLAYWLIAPAVVVHAGRPRPADRWAALVLSFKNLNTFTFLQLFDAPWTGLDNYEAILDAANPLSDGLLRRRPEHGPLHVLDDARHARRRPGRRAAAQPRDARAASGRAR